MKLELSSIINRGTRDKNFVCLLLHFTYGFLDNWYNDYNERIIRVVVYGGYKQLDKEERIKVYQFITGTQYASVAKTLISNFRQIQLKRHESDYLSNIIDKKDLDHIMGIVKNVNGFLEFS
jgi:hypothetical protein